MSKPAPEIVDTTSSTPLKGLVTLDRNIYLSHKCLKLETHLNNSKHSIY